MSLFVEFHLIQNFAPSNLNRDDTGAPKEAVFGGHRRARVSSQCFKRAIRLQSAESELLPEDARGVRTKKLVELVSARLAELGYPEAKAQIETALSAAGLKVKDDGKTEYLLFLGNAEIEAFAQLVKTHWDALSSVLAPAGGEKKSKKDAKATVPDEVQKAAKYLLDGGKAVDVALFGRMLADLPGASRDAACQVAHSISTHKVDREFDYFTAIDDMAKPDEASAAHLDTTEFNSATFYRYAALDARKLDENLQGDRELTLNGIVAFTKAVARAIPTGKQNSFAAQNLPGFIGVVLRGAGPMSLANAFERPVWPRQDKALSALSVEAMAAHDSLLAGVYGNGQDAWAFIDLTGSWPETKGEKLASLDALGDWVKEKVAARLGA